MFKQYFYKRSVLCKTRIFWDVVLINFSIRKKLFTFLDQIVWISNKISKRAVGFRTKSIEKQLKNNSKASYVCAINTLEKMCEKALWLSNSFGLVPESFKSKSEANTLHISKKKKMLYIYMINLQSNAAYMDLSLFSTGMPRFSSVGHWRDDLNFIFYKTFMWPVSQNRTY